MVLFVFLAKGDPSFELVTLFIDVLDVIGHELGLGLVGLYHPPLIEKMWSSNLLRNHLDGRGINLPH